MPERLIITNNKRVQAAGLVRKGRLISLSQSVVNGVQVGHDQLSNMGWTFEDMVVYASRGTWVKPRAGGRNGSQTPPPLKIGDVVTLTVQGIESVSTTVVPAARHRLAR